MPNLRQNLILREKIIDAIRDYFKKENFLEVETPLLLPSVIPESYLEHFTTTLFDRRRSKKKMFLASSPEASLKKLLSQGLGNCFEITKSFRNGETDSLLHSPEFTILEWYRVGTDYKDVMRDCERLILHIYESIFCHAEFSSASHSRKEILKSPPSGGILAEAGQVQDDKKIKYQGDSIDLSPPWERISVAESLKKYANIDFDDITPKRAIARNCDYAFTTDRIINVALAKGYQVSTRNSWEEIFNQIFLNEVEPHLGTKGKPAIIYDYPAPLAALAKIKKDDPRVSERFELYIGGLELGDCYTELTDWKEQDLRFKNELKIIRNSKKTVVTPDKRFIKALKKGIPECAGMAIGIDRIVMLFGDISDIKDTKFIV